MISKRVYTKEYISRLREGSKCDPAILERSVFALGLLEAFARTRVRNQMNEDLKNYYAGMGGV